MPKLGTDQFPSYREVYTPIILQAGYKIDTKDESTAVCLNPTNPRS